MSVACNACGFFDCPCGCNGNPNICTCEEILRRNPVCEGCGLEGCECQTLGYCVCDQRRNPWWDDDDDDDEEWTGMVRGPGGRLEQSFICTSCEKEQPLSLTENAIRFIEGKSYGICKSCKYHPRRNPDPEGSPWGPSLYNPLNDGFHEFKDDSSYRSIASRFKRNPWTDIGDQYE